VLASTKAFMPANSAAFEAEGRSAENCADAIEAHASSEYVASIVFFMIIDV
jgi:hypothetical protein